MEKGTVYLVGFGPGNPDLLTVGALKILNKADCIFYDDLTDHDYLQQFEAELIYVGKRKDAHSKEQDEINLLLLAAANTGKTVVRLKGGDPMIFAHGGEEIAYLEENGVEVQVIPGITTASAFAAYTKIPLTYRNIASSVSFVTGHSLSDIQIPNTDTIVFYMAGTKIRAIAQRMIEEGFAKETPVALTHGVSLPTQQEFYYTLDQLAENDITFPTPVIIVIGKVVSLKR